MKYATAIIIDNGHIGRRNQTPPSPFGLKKPKTQGKSRSSSWAWNPKNDRLLTGRVIKVYPL
jgi:hypothetical protein